MLAAGFGTAVAGNATPDGIGSADQQQETAKDCKKNPSDPRCKGDQ
jgi:hypothetical protein